MIKLFKILLIIMLVALPSFCLADVSGYLFLGKYYSHKKNDLEGREINYNAGVYLELESRWITLFTKDETLIGDIDGGRSYPKQINYMIGIKRKYKAIELIITHECLHPVDGASNGEKATSYNLIEGRLNF